MRQVVFSANLLNAAGPNLDEGTYGVWRIDDSDNSFSTQPFKIKYARQDVLLSVMIAFNLSMGDHVVISLSPYHLLSMLYAMIFIFPECL